MKVDTSPAVALRACTRSNARCLRLADPLPTSSVTRNAWAIATLASTALMSNAWGQRVDYVPPEPQPLTLCVAEQVSYDSNLFRLNDNSEDAAQRLGNNSSRDDTIFRTTACAVGNWRVAQQAFSLDLSADDNRYRKNRVLNHTSGIGKLQWDWRSADSWYGKLGGSYQHSLGSFLNDRPLEKDLVDATRFFAEINHDIGTYVNVHVGGTRSETTHDAASRQVDDYRNTSGDAGLTFTSRAENYVGVTYKVSEARYPYDAIVNSLTVDRDYEERTSGIRFRYAPASRTVLRGSAGYLSREYLNASDSDYSGNVWRLSLNWQPTLGTQLELAGWQELSAYFDSEADHFISRGTSIVPSWTPRRSLKIAGLFSLDRQQYLARSQTVQPTAARDDKVFTSGLDVTYQPGEVLQVGLRYHREQHDSSLPAYEFDDQISSLQLSARF